VELWFDSRCGSASSCPYGKDT